MALLEYRPRPKLRGWATPEPPPPRRTKFYFYALTAWAIALFVGYVLVWNGRGSPLQSDESTAQESPEQDDSLGVPRAAEGGLSVAQTSPREATRGDAPDSDRERVPVAAGDAGPGNLPSCETFLSEARQGDSDRMPASLERSPVDAFLGHDDWFKPCTSKHRRRTVDFCVALRDGAIVGITTRAHPKDLTLETCVQEQALKVVLRAEPNLRIVRARLAL